MTVAKFKDDYKRIIKLTSAEQVKPLQKLKAQLIRADKKDPKKSIKDLIGSISKRQEKLKLLKKKVPASKSGQNVKVNVRVSGANEKLMSGFVGDPPVNDPTLAARRVNIGQSTIAPVARNVPILDEAGLKAELVNTVRATVGEKGSTQAPVSVPVPQIQQVQQVPKEYQSIINAMPSGIKQMINNAKSSKSDFLQILFTPLDDGHVTIAPIMRFIEYKRDIQGEDGSDAKLAEQLLRELQLPNILSVIPKYKPETVIVTGPPVKGRIHKGRIHEVTSDERTKPTSPQQPIPATKDNVPPVVKRARAKLTTDAKPKGRPPIRSATERGLTNQLELARNRRIRRQAGQDVGTETGTDVKRAIERPAESVAVVTDTNSSKRSGDTNPQKDTTANLVTTSDTDLDRNATLFPFHLLPAVSADEEGFAPMSQISGRGLYGGASNSSMNLSKIYTQTDSLGRVYEQQILEHNVTASRNKWKNGVTRAIVDPENPELQTSIMGGTIQDPKIDNSQGKINLKLPNKAVVGNRTFTAPTDSRVYEDQSKFYDANITGLKEIDRRNDYHDEYIERLSVKARPDKKCLNATIIEHDFH